MKKHCCETMCSVSKLSCEQHSNEFDCPDVLVSYNEKFDEYGLIIRDGGAAVSHINYCPYCGFSLPESKRDLWFDTLESMGFDDPGEQDIPKQFLSGSWYNEKAL
jgi:hypothetical protein